MPHFFVDDGFSDSKEVMAIPARYRLAAVGLWTLCGSWSANKLTNGFVSSEVLKRLGARPNIVAALIENAGLWEQVSDGIRFTNWSKWQRTREQVVSYRAEQAEKKRRQREAAKQASNSDDANMSPGDIRGENESCPLGTPRARGRVPPEPIPKPDYVTHLDERSYETNARERDQLSRPITVGATRLVQRSIPQQSANDSIRAKLRIEASQLLAAGENEADVETALRLWLAKPDLGPKALSSLMAEVYKSRNGTNGIGKATQKALGYRQLGNELIEELHGDQP